MSNPLYLARYGMEAEDADLGDADCVWTDYRRGQDGSAWAALVANEEIAKEIESNFGTKLLSIQEWDGTRFGDGHSGGLERVADGVLYSEFEYDAETPGYRMLHHMAEEEVWRLFQDIDVSTFLERMGEDCSNVAVEKYIEMIKPNHKLTEDAWAAIAIMWMFYIDQES